MEQMKANGWTENQLCPECGKEPGSCDWCHECDIELVCAQSDWGLEQATKITRDGVAYLILARPGSGKAWQTC
jgi:predicted metal-binding protein